MSPTIRSFLLLSIIGISIAAVPAHAQQRIRIGVFDSRIVALCYYNSEAGAQARADLRKYYDEAKAAGDKEAVGRLERKGMMTQAMMHDQVFGTGSIGNLDDLLKDRIAGLAKEKKLVLVVSKWELKNPSPSLEQVDLTDELIDLFKPDEKMRKNLQEMRNVAPVKDALFIED